MVFFVALLILVGVYVIVKLLLSKVEPVAAYADVLALVIGILAALFYAGAI